MPTSRHSDDVLLAARGLLTQIGRQAEEITVTIETAGITLRLIKRKSEPWPTCLDGGVRRYSPLERDIVAALADGEWRTAARIAEASSNEPSARFSYLLTNLAEAGIVESCQRRGYRMADGHATKLPEA